MSASETPGHAAGNRGAADPQETDRGPIARALDLGVFAPLGLALEFRTVIPELAEAGRRQIAFSQSLGRTAIKAILNGLDADGRVAQKPASETVALPGYDEMTARAVVAIIRDSDAATLSWMRDHETANKQRVTVLRAIAAQTRSS